MTMGMLTDKAIVESGGPIALVIHHGLLLLAVLDGTDDFLAQFLPLLQAAPGPPLAP